MGWIKNDNLTKYYQLKLLKRGKVTKVLDFETKEDADRYVAHLKELKRIEREDRAKDQELERKLDELERITEEIIAQTLICSGLVKRQKHWVAVKDLRHPLTNEEKAHIRKVNRNAVKWSLPANWPKEISTLTMSTHV